MLKSHPNLLQPRPSDRLRIGDRVVDIPLREIAPADGGEPVRITLKALGVLLALVAHAGKPVSREALFEWVWPDTLPTDDVLTQAVTQLRKALGDERERPRYIDTIAKQGYRLIAAVAWLEDETTGPSIDGAAPPPVDVPDASPAPRSPWPRRAAAVAVVGTLAVAGAWMFSRPAPRRPDAPAAGGAAPTQVHADFLRIASLPLPEEMPTLSPDGALVVYSRYQKDEQSAALVLQTVSATPPRALTPATPGQKDLMPAWSSDGQRIAFSRVTDGRCRIMVVAVSGGAAQELGECLAESAHPVAWYPDGKALIGAQRPGGASKPIERALYRMALDQRRWQRLAYERSASDEDMSPSVSPDGRWIAFHRNLSLADIWRMPVAGGKPERLTSLRTNLYGLTWTPDNRHLVFARYREGRTYLSRLDIASGGIVELASGQDSLLYPAVSRSGDVLAFEVGNIQSRMRQVRLADGEGALDASRRLHESSGSNLMPAVSPDGQQLLFYSSRTGVQRLWWIDQREPDTLRSFESFSPIPRYPAVWHPQSRTALVIGTQDGEAYGIYEIDPERGRLTRLPVPDRQPVHVAWHPDPSRLYVVADRGEGRLGITLYDRSVTPWRALARLSDVAATVVDPVHRRVLMASPSTPEIRSADLDLNDLRVVDKVVIPRRARSMVATADGVRVLDSTPECSWYWRPIGQGATGGQCLGRIDWHLEGVTLDGGSGTLYVSVVEERQADIGVLPLSAFDAQDGGQVPQAATSH